MEELGPYSVNSIVCADCFNVLSHLPDECIDLIYIDPPFYSGSNYKTNDGNDAFIDKWTSLDAYLDWLLERVLPMKRILKETGSIYVHLDWHASHYVKVRMDEIFGIGNFRNEIIWRYRTGNVSRRQFQRKHNTIFLYSKSANMKYKPLEQKEYYVQVYGPGFEPSFKGRKHNKDERGAYRISLIDDVWDVSAVFTLSKEKQDYPTQKPEALLERIIKASSNENDIIADFFCGSGTTLVVAERLGRKWFGCDTNPEAVKISLERIEKERAKYPLF